eukprot:scaffold269444_cov15-Tisochrysis_lutea.AAC.1
MGHTGGVASSAAAGVADEASLEPYMSIVHNVHRALYIASCNQNFSRKGMDTEVIGQVCCDLFDGTCSIRPARLQLMALWSYVSPFPWLM